MPKGLWERSCRLPAAESSPGRFQKKGSLRLLGLRIQVQVASGPRIENQMEQKLESEMENWVHVEPHGEHLLQFLVILVTGVKVSGFRVSAKTATPFLKASPPSQVTHLSAGLQDYRAVPPERLR